jgi:hypothetical protein
MLRHDKLTIASLSVRAHTPSREINGSDYTLQSDFCTGIANHLCDEFCHLRLFAGMFKVFGVRVDWPLLSWPMHTAYAAFARFPDWVLAPVAFGSEVMGMMLYRHIWHGLEEVFASEPEASGHGFRP